VVEVIALIVRINGSIPCGCSHCRAQDMPSGKLIEATYIGLGESLEDAREDALQQAFQRDPHAELEATVVDSVEAVTA
jgi:hypothetical protein